MSDTMTAGIDIDIGKSTRQGWPYKVKPIRIEVSTRDCWIVKNHGRTSGYPVKNFLGKRQTIVRILYERMIGQIPTGLITCHTCDNRLCVNPNHIFLGTHLDNARDRDRKKRWRPRGESYRPASKLNVHDVKMIRQGKDPARVVARKYGVSDKTVFDVRRRYTWQNV